MYPLRLQSRGFRHSPQANEETVIEPQSGHKARTKAKEQTPHLALGAVGRSNACSRSCACGHLYLQGADIDGRGSGSNLARPRAIVLADNAGPSALVLGNRKALVAKPQRSMESQKN